MRGWLITAAAPPAAAASLAQTNKLVMGAGSADPTLTAQAMIVDLAARVRQSRPAAMGNAAVLALCEDIEGQVTIAFSRDEFFTKWGCHYLPALVRAHTMEQVTTVGALVLRVRWGAGVWGFDGTCMAMI